MSSAAIVVVAVRVKDKRNNLCSVSLFWTKWFNPDATKENKTPLHS